MTPDSTANTQGPSGAHTSLGQNSVRQVAGTDFCSAAKIQYICYLINSWLRYLTPPIINVMPHRSEASPLSPPLFFFSSRSLSASFAQESPGGELASPLTPVTPPMENINGTDEICDTTPNSDSLPGPAQNALAFAHRYMSRHDALTVARYRICCSRDFTVWPCV